MENNYVGDNHGNTDANIPDFDINENNNYLEAMWEELRLIPHEDDWLYMPYAEPVVLDEMELEEILNQHEEPVPLLLLNDIPSDLTLLELTRLYLDSVGESSLFSMIKTWNATELISVVSRGKNWSDCCIWLYGPEGTPSSLHRAVLGSEEYFFCEESNWPCDLYDCTLSSKCEIAESHVERKCMCNIRNFRKILIFISQ